MEWNHLCNFERGHHGEHMKFGPVVQEMLIKKFTDDGQRPITRAHLEPSAQVSLKVAWRFPGRRYPFRGFLFRVDTYLIKFQYGVLVKENISPGCFAQ